VVLPRHSNPFVSDVPRRGQPYSMMQSNSSSVLMHAVDINWSAPFRKRKRPVPSCTSSQTTSTGSANRGTEQRRRRVRRLAGGRPATKTTPSLYTASAIRRCHDDGLTPQLLVSSPTCHELGIPVAFGDGDVEYVDDGSNSMADTVSDSYSSSSDKRRHQITTTMTMGNHLTLLRSSSCNVTSCQRNG